jgi:hypothetical protein
MTVSNLPGTEERASAGVRCLTLNKESKHYSGAQSMSQCTSVCSSVDNGAFITSFTLLYQTKGHSHIKFSFSKALMILVSQGTNI